MFFLALLLLSFSCLHPVAFAIKLKYLGMMNESIDCRSGCLSSLKILPHLPKARLLVITTLRAANRHPVTGRPIFLATRSLFTFVVVTLFVLVYDMVDKTIKYCGS